MAKAVTYNLNPQHVHQHATDERLDALFEETGKVYEDYTATGSERIKAQIKQREADVQETLLFEELKGKTMDFGTYATLEEQNRYQEAQTAKSYATKELEKSIQAEKMALTALVDKVKLSDLSAVADQGYQLYEQKANIYNLAAIDLELANKKVGELKDNLGDEPTTGAQKAYWNAEDDLKEAEQRVKDTSKELEEVGAAAKRAIDALNAKKELLEEGRNTDLNYVVHTAQVKCSCGLRSSLLVLPESHGIYIKGRPQLTIDDCKAINFIDFGGCTSSANETRGAFAAKVVEEARKAIAKKKDWLGNWIKPEIDIKDSVLDESIGICEYNREGLIGEWRRGKEQVLLNGFAPLLRRGYAHCKYGGMITLETSGQPEE